MRVFLSGGRGMVGRSIIEHARASEYEISAPVSAELDLTDAGAVETALADLRPDIVIHCAGRVGGIQANMAHPAAFLHDNMVMGLNLVQAARKAGVRQLINLGSSCMYPFDALNPLSEQSIGSGRLEPTNEGYALAKVAVARYCDFVAVEELGLAYKTLIPCNLYGYHDKFDPKVSHLVPAIIRKIHEAKVAQADTVEIWADGTARREFMFSADLADAVWTAVARFDTLPQMMNVGVGQDHSINDYYRIAAEVIGWKGQFVHDLSKPAGMKQKLLDVSRQAAFGWTPATGLREGIEQTYDHFLSLSTEGAA